MMTAMMARVVAHGLVPICLSLISGALGAVVVAPVQAQELRLITSPWPPSNYLDAAGNPIGLSVAIVTALKEKLELSTPIEVIPWARGYNIAQSEPNTMLFTAAKTSERVGMGFEFIGPAVMWSHGLLAKRGSDLEVESLEDASRQGLTAVGVRGSWQVELLKKAGIQTVEVADQTTSARMLLAGRVDLWITSQLQASTVLTEVGVQATAATPVFTIRRSPSYLMISEGTEPQLLHKWRMAYDELKAEDTLHAIAREWSTRLGVTLRYSPEDGFSADGSGKDGTG